MFTQATITAVEFVLKYIGRYWAIAGWGESSNLIVSIIIALLFGLIFSYFANNDKLHKYLRDKKITHKTSFATQWFDVFLNPAFTTFVVLHFNDERRLYGWPTEWSSTSTEGHFVITDPSWLLDNGEAKPIIGVKNILVNVNDVNG